MAMDMKVEIVSKEIIKPSSPTPNHLRDFKLSMLDQLAPQHYVPIVLFYSASDVNNFASNSNSTILERLKNSLSETLTRFYPLAGRINGSTCVECNDEGVLFVEARAKTELSMILENPEINLLHQFLPFDPYKAKTDIERVITVVQVNVFDCGGIGVGIGMSHKVADGTTLASFLYSWAETATGVGENLVPYLDSALLFPPRDINLVSPSSVTRKQNNVTRRFIFKATSLASLRARVGDKNYTRIESVTALIWKSALEAAKVNSKKDTLPKSIAIHIVNIRGKMDPPMPDHALGNLWQSAAASLMEEEIKEVELGCLAAQIRKSIRKIDSDHVSKLQGDDGIANALKTLKEVHLMASKGEVNQCYGFTSWARFPFYKTDFGWGNPTWVCTTCPPFNNFVILMSAPDDGIEAWVTLPEHDMVQFEQNHELCQFTSPNY